MFTTDTMIERLEYLRNKALKKGDIALAYRIQDSQNQRLMELRKADPLDLDLMSNEELAEFLVKLKQRLSKIKGLTKMKV